MKKDARAIDGHSPTCKPCQAGASSVYYYENYDARAEYRNSRIEAKRTYDRAYSRVLVADGRAVEKGRKRRARKTGGACESATAAEIRDMTEERGVYACAACWGPAEHLDHIIPLSRGGCDAAHNLQWLCAPCNLSKGARLMEEWFATRQADSTA